MMIGILVILSFRDLLKRYCELTSSVEMRIKTCMQLLLWTTGAKLPVFSVQKRSSALITCTSAAYIQIKYSRQFLSQKQTL